MFECIERPNEIIFRILNIEKILIEWNRLCDVFIKRMALRIHNLPSKRLKLRLCLCRWSEDSWFLKAFQTHFLHFGHSKEWFVRSPRYDVSSRRIHVRTHNLPTVRLPKRLCWIRWSDISRCRKAKWTHFLISAYQENRLGRRRLSDVLSSQKVLRTHNQPPEYLRMQHWWCRWSEVSRCQKTIRTQFPHSWHSKSDFDEVVEVMI
jgi:hypothetical protein